MKALSILQPYAWLIVHGHKDIENRDWRSALRGTIYVHAGKRYSLAEHEAYIKIIARDFGIQLPAYNDIPRGGIVGTVEIIGCVREHPSRWKADPSWGFVLANARPLPFRPLRGQLGFFDVPDDI